MLAKHDLQNVMQHVDESLHLLKHAAVMKDKGRLSKTFTQADPLLG
jgi:ABC-type Mn2+/Zn2+ transport system ATPase subunit